MKNPYFSQVKYALFLVLSIIFAACSLNAGQEKSLNKAMSAYVQAYNTGALHSRVSYTHPSVVRHYKEQGDQAFQAKFAQPHTDGEPRLLVNGIIRQIRTKGKKIHVLFEFSLGNRRSEKEELLAISDDEGRIWWFLEKADYDNDRIIESQERIIQREK